MTDGEKMMSKVAVMGYGTVGGGVVNVLHNTGIAEVKYILDIREFPGDPFEKLLVNDIGTILADDEISVVCETMGGLGAAYEFTKRALEAGKSVCTSNKELVAEHGSELQALALTHGCQYLFEASVGGGIPLIRTIRFGMVAERITSIAGILNGTTNFILSQMIEHGASYDAVLKQAQEMGYAERDPSADVDGHDAARKIAILISVVCGHRLDVGEIETVGISHISQDEIDLARRKGEQIKLIAAATFEEDGIHAQVAPYYVPHDHPLSIARDVYNAVLIGSDNLEDTLLYGQGAGKMATASAVVADVAACMRAGTKVCVPAWDRETVHIKKLQTGIRGLSRVEI